MRTGVKLATVLAPRPFDLVSLFANGENGFLFEPMSDLTRLFTTSAGPTQVAANDDPVGLMLDRSKWAGKTLAQVLAAQTELRGSGAPGGAGTFTPATYNTGTGVGTAVRTNVNNRSWVVLSGQTVSQTYAVDIENTGATTIQVRDTGGANVLATVSIGARSTVHVVPMITDGLRIDNPTDGTSIAFTVHSIKLVPGNHALTAITTVRPLYKTNSGKPYLLPDGTDDALTTPFIPTAALTMAVSVRFPSSPIAGIVMGGGASTDNKRAYVGMNVTTGTIAVGWGDESLGFLSNVGPALNGTDHVIVVTGDATSRDIWIDGVLVHTRVPTLGPNGTGGGFSLGGYNNNGSLSTPSASRIYAALAMNRRVTPAEIARITSQFQRTYQ